MADVSSILLEEGYTKIDTEDSRRFFVQAVIKEIIDPLELNILCRWRLGGASLKELSEEFDVTPMAIFLNTVSTRLRLLRFFTKYKKPKKVKKVKVAFHGNIAGF